MTIKATITSAIKKAVNNGYTPVPGRKATNASVVLQTTTSSHVTFTVRAGETSHAIMVGLNDVIFDHNFAKAIWGDDFLEHLKLLACQNTVKGRISYIGSTK